MADSSFGGSNTIPTSTTGFTRCVDCGGMGFHRSGDFANRSFPRCKKCDGLGQRYLEPSKAADEVWF